MNEDYLPEQYMERLREANAAIIEFEQLIASREDELRSARQEIANLRARIESARAQGAIIEAGEDAGDLQAGAAGEDGGAGAGKRVFTANQVAELRLALEEVVNVANELRTEALDLLPPGVLERLDEMINRARAACELF